MAQPKLFADSISRYYGGIAEKRAYGGQGTITVFRVGEVGSDPATWQEIKGHGKTPGERKTDALRRYQAGERRPLPGNAPLATLRRDLLKGAGRGRGRGLGYPASEHLEIGLRMVSSAEHAYARAQEVAARGDCQAAIANLDVAGRYFGQAEAHMIATSTDQPHAGLNTDGLEERVDKLATARQRTQIAIRAHCLRPNRTR